MPVITLDTIARLGAELRQQGKIIVFTNGHFDLLHVGHVRYLQAAAGLGDVLFVGINNDAMTRQRKGPGRPILPETERAELIAMIRCVAYAAIFAEPTAKRVIDLLKPDIYAKGGDYGPGGLELPEAAVVDAYGGRVEILPLVPGRSTSAIIEAIRSGRGIQ